MAYGLTEKRKRELMEMGRKMNELHKSIYSDRRYQEALNRLCEKKGIERVLE